MKEITYEEYRGMLNGWEDENKPGVGKYITRVPQGKHLVISGGRYFIADKESVSIGKVKKAKSTSHGNNK